MEISGLQTAEAVVVGYEAQDGKCFGKACVAEMGIVADVDHLLVSSVVGASIKSRILNGSRGGCWE